MHNITPTFIELLHTVDVNFTVIRNAVLNWRRLIENTISTYFFKLTNQFRMQERKLFVQTTNNSKKPKFTQNVHLYVYTGAVLRRIVKLLIEKKKSYLLGMTSCIKIYPDTKRLKSTSGSVKRHKILTDRQLIFLRPWWMFYEFLLVAIFVTWSMVRGYETLWHFLKQNFNFWIHSSFFSNFC